MCIARGELLLERLEENHKVVGHQGMEINMAWPLMMGPSKKPRRKLP